MHQYLIFVRLEKRVLLHIVHLSLDFEVYGIAVKYTIREDNTVDFERVLVIFYIVTFYGHV
jgi:hypothetical protein